MPLSRVETSQRHTHSKDMALRPGTVALQPVGERTLRLAVGGAKYQFWESGAHWANIGYHSGNN